jgi:LPXTG-motif cell wall-anchored protein
VKFTTPKNWASRAVAIGASLAMVGGVTLVAAAPAQAAVTPDNAYSQSAIYASDIVPSGSVGWHTIGATGANTASITAAGIEIAGTAGLGYGYSADAQADGYNLLSEVSQGQVSWATSAGKAFFQIGFTFGANQSTTLTSAAASSKTTVNGGDDWVTSAAIGSEQAAGATASLNDLVSSIMSQPNVKVTGFGVVGDGAATTVTNMAWSWQSYTFHPENRVAAGTVAITGSYTVGSVLTAVPAGWPEGSTVTYQWFFSGGNFGGAIENATAASYTLAASDSGMHIGVDIIVTKPGFGPNIARADLSTATVTDAAKAAAAAPVSSSTGLAAYLASKSVTTQTQVSTGLPSGDLNPSKAQTATLTWTGAGDGFVDVYVYSSPTFVGTFPVVNGAVQVTLSAAVLSSLAAGGHTLVVTGQTSGTVQSVALSVAEVLPATGVDITVPLTVGSLLLLLGAALILVRRRRVRA